MPYPSDIEFHDTVRLIPAQYSEETVLSTLELPEAVVADLTELDAATNERKQAELYGAPGIGVRELVYGVPEWHIINAAFCHPGQGGRFHDATRGAWYAGRDLATSTAEVTFHKRRFLKDARFEGTFHFAYRSFLADFAGAFYSLDEQEQRTCLEPGPVRECYAAPQALARSLLHEGAAGIVYPSVRYPAGTCVVCFRPALVYRVRRGAMVDVVVSS